MDPLAPIREKIDQVDRQLVALLNERLGLAAEIGHRKRGLGGEIYVPAREDAVLRKVAGLNAGPLRPEALQAIYREIMSAALALEKPRFAIAFPGPEGNRTQAAAIAKFGASVSYRSSETIAAVFAAMERGEVDYAVVPFDHPPAAEASETLDRLVGSKLRIIARMEGVSPPARYFHPRPPTFRPRWAAGATGPGYLVSPGGADVPPAGADAGFLRPLAERGIGLPAVESLPSGPGGAASRGFSSRSRSITTTRSLRAALAELGPTGALVQWLGGYPGRGLTR